MDFIYLSQVVQAICREREREREDSKLFLDSSSSFENATEGLAVLVKCHCVWLCEIFKFGFHKSELGHHSFS